jgi:thiol-disulfide isomerase/thioredoxin
MLRASLLACSLTAAGLAGYFLTSRPAAKRVASASADETRSVTDVASLGEARLMDLRDGAWTHLSPRSDYSLLIFLSASDCSSCVNELRVWQELSQKYPESQLEVSAVIVRSSAEEAAVFLKAYDPAIDFYLDGYEDVEKAVSLPEQTPLKVLVNSSGEVLLTDGPQPTAAGQQKFGDMVVASISPAQESR